MGTAVALNRRCVKDGKGYKKNDNTRDDTVRIFHQNIQCLNTSILELEALLKTLKNSQEIICLTEHWMRPEELLISKIEGYNMISSSTRIHSIRGGTCIFVKEDLGDFQELKSFEDYNIEGHLEICSVISEKRKLLVFCVYRSCLGSYEVFYQLFEIIIRKAFEGFKSYSIVWSGDFNINFWTHNDDLTKTEIKNRNKMLDLFATYNFQQTIFDITRPNKIKKSCIDNLFVNSNLFSNNCVIKTGISDHYAQTISLTVNGAPKSTEPLIVGRVFSGGKLSQCQELMRDCAWAGVYGGGDVDAAYSALIGTITSLLNLIFPKKNRKYRTHRNSHWVTAGIRKSIINKRQLFELCLSGAVSKTYYKNYNKILKTTIKKAKKLSNKHFIENSENKTKATWNLINKITKNKNKNQSVFENFKEEESPNFLNKINNFFLDSCPNICQNTENLNILKYNKKSFKFRQTTPEEVEKIIKNLKNKKSVGMDEIPVALLKSTAHIVSKPLSFIMNLCFKTGKFPSALKYSIVKPLFKNKGGKNDLKNYRPISLLSNISKIFEKIMHEQITDFLENHQILSENQNGFRKGKSTIRAIYQTLKVIIQTLNKRRIATALCIDLTKAFDSVDHGILKKKLEACGVRGTALSLIESLIEGRWQCTEVLGGDGKSVRSAFGAIDRGVPQGGVLSPLLYILYTNDITDIIENKNIVLFADDKTIVYDKPTTQTTKNDIENDLGTLNDWFKSNNLLLNISKTQLMQFKPKTTNDSLCIEYRGEELKTQDEILFLGVVLDKNLNWEAHVEKVAAKLSQFCYALRVMRDAVGFSASLTSCHAYVQSRIRYGIIFWGGATGAERILKLQKRCLRVILKLNKKQSCREHFIKLKIDTIYNIYILESVKFIIRNTDLFEDQKIEHRYCTRQKDNLKTDIPHFTYLQKNVTFNIKKIWNSLPNCLKTQTNKIIEKKIRRLLENRAYYSIEEYYTDNQKTDFLN